MCRNEKGEKRKHEAKTIFEQINTDNYAKLK